MVNLDKTDKALEYEALKHKIERILNSLKAVGLDITKYESMLANTEQNLNESLEKANNNPTKYLENDYLSQVYIKANKTLNAIYLELKEYNVYLRAASLTNKLKLYLSNDSLGNDELQNLKADLIKVLDALRESKTLDYNVEKTLISSIYEVTLTFIKEEIKAFGTSYVLQLLQGHDSHIYQLDKIITKELESIDLNLPENASIAKRKYELDEAGTNRVYTDEELLRLIINRKDPLEIKSTISKLNNNLRLYLTKLENLNRDKEILEGKVNSTKNKKYKLKKELPKRIAALTASIASAVGITVASFSIADKNSMYTTYENTITTYTEGNDTPTIRTEYLNNDRDYQKLIQYMPYHRTLYSTYERDFLIYDLSSMPNLSLEEALALDLDGLNILGIGEESKDVLTPAEKIDKINYALEKAKVNLEKCDENHYSIRYYVVLSVCLIVTIILEAILELAIYIKAFKYNSTPIAFIQSIKRLKGTIKDIKKNNTFEKEKVKALTKVLKQAQDLINSNKELISEAIRIRDNYNNYANELNANLEQVQELEQKLSR